MSVHSIPGIVKQFRNVKNPEGVQYTINHRQINSVMSYKNILVFILITVIAGFVFLGCDSEELSDAPFRVYSTIDSTTVKIGDVLHFQVWAKSAGERKIDFPPLNIPDPNISIGAKRDLKGEYEDDYGIEFEISLWDTGTFVIPSYPVHILTAYGDSVDYSISTDPVTVQVISVLIDTQPQLRDLKPPIPLPVVIPYGLIFKVVALILLLGFLFWVWKKRVPSVNEEEKPYIPSKPPFDIAIEKLLILKKNDLDTSQKVKEFYTELSYIVREYLEYQYFIRCIEMTTEEIEESGKLIPVEEEAIIKVIDVLKRADLAKFAKFQPIRTQCLSDLDTIEKFIHSTRLFQYGQTDNAEAEIAINN